MKRILICQHGGSGNHGCEALARTTVGLLRQRWPQAKITLYSYSIIQDKKYLSDLEGVDIRGLFSLPGRLSAHNVSYHIRRVMGRPASKLPLNQEFKSLAAAADLVVAIGGDNYCYNMGRGYWALDEYIKSLGKPYMLFGCSIEPEDLPGGLGNHLRIFDRITVRERISYDAMRAFGLDNAVYAPDPAFLLEKCETTLPQGLDPAGAIGLNFSPLVIKNEKTPGMTLKAFAHLAQHILDNTDCQLALIPHVVWESSDDRQALASLHSMLGRNPRVFNVSDRPAGELKQIIGGLQFFVGARTHSTIAAYSSCVPTLTLGYSVKARGIAQDLFGQQEGYVIPVQGLEREDQLTTAFAGLYARRDELRRHLEEIMPAYKAEAGRAVEYMLGDIEAEGRRGPGAALAPHKDSVAGLIGRERCTGCGACAVVCPVGCISMAPGPEGFLHPAIDEGACTGCGACRRVCPAARPAGDARPIQAWAVAANDKAGLARASSGGVFGLLAAQVLEAGGVVFGAAFDGNMELSHQKAETPAELEGLFSSKYLQSSSHEAMAQALEYLRAGRRVLFCGTTCQANAMALLTPKGLRQNLLLADVVCHGVPSPMIFGRYRAQLEAEAGASMASINFRDKSTGWQGYSVSAAFENGEKITQSATENPYMRLFLHNYSLGRSCYNCAAKKAPLADITLGDFWGVKRLVPGFEWQGGASLVLARTPAGKQAVAALDAVAAVKETPVDGPEKYNPCIYASPPRPPRREEFFADLGQGLSITALAEKYAEGRPSAVQRLKKIIRK